MTPQHQPIPQTQSAPKASTLGADLDQKIRRSKRCLSASHSACDPEPVPDPRAAPPMQHRKVRLDSLPARFNGMEVGSQSISKPIKLRTLTKVTAVLRDCSRITAPRARPLSPCTSSRTGGIASSGNPSRFHSSYPPRSGRTRSIPSLCSVIAVFAAVASLGTGAEQHHIPVPRNFNMPRRQRIRRKMHRARQRERLSHHFQRMPQVHDVHLLARIELRLQLLRFQPRSHQLLQHRPPPIHPHNKESQDAQHQQRTGEPPHPVQQARIPLQRIAEESAHQSAGQAATGMRQFRQRTGTVPRLIPFSPATGAASVARPGTNFANISITLRRRPKESCVRRTQIVGSIESLQRMRSTWCP